MPQYSYISYKSPFDEVVRVADTLPTQATDSLSCDNVVPSFITSGFGGSIVPLPRMTYEVVQGWNLVLMALVLLLIVLNKQLYPRQFRQVLSVPGGVTHTNQLLREWNPANSLLGVTFMLAYMVIMALFVQKSFVILSRDTVQYNDFRFFGIVFACVTGWVVFRQIFLVFISWLFGTKEAVERQQAVQLSVSTFSLIVMLVLLLVILYTPSSLFVWMGFGILCATSLLRFVLGIVETRFSTKIPLFYIFSYFCALEIAPVAMLLTASLRYFSNGSVY